MNTLSVHCPGKEKAPENDMPLVSSLCRKIPLLLLLLVLSACATAGFQAGETKNSLPLSAREALEEIHSIAVPPFYGDTVQWRERTNEVLSSFAGQRLSVIPLPKVDSAIAPLKNDLAAAAPEARNEVLRRAGLAGADAVVNGVVFWKERPEIIIQVISTRDGRLLYWQAADFTMKEGPSAQGQRDLLSTMLDPVRTHAGKRPRPVPPAPQPVVEMRPKMEPAHEEAPAQRPEVQKQERRQKPDRRKGSRPAPVEEDISPM